MTITSPSPPSVDNNISLPRQDQVASSFKPLKKILARPNINIPESAHDKAFKSKASGIKYQISTRYKKEDIEKLDQALAKHPQFHIIKKIIGDDFKIIFSSRDGEIKSQKEIEGIASVAHYGKNAHIMVFKKDINSSTLKESCDDFVRIAFHEIGHLFAKKIFGDTHPIEDKEYQAGKHKIYSENKTNGSNQASSAATGESKLANIYSIKANVKHKIIDQVAGARLISQASKSGRVGQLLNALIESDGKKLLEACPSEKISSVLDNQELLNPIKKALQHFNNMECVFAGTELLKTQIETAMKPADDVFAQKIGLTREDFTPLIEYTSQVLDDFDKLALEYIPRKITDISEDYSRDEQNQNKKVYHNAIKEGIMVSSYGNANSSEDFAEAFACCLLFGSEGHGPLKQDNAERFKAMGNFIHDFMNKKYHEGDKHYLKRQWQKSAIYKKYEAMRSALKRNKNTA